MWSVPDSVTIVNDGVLLAVAENINLERRGWTASPIAYLVD